MFANKYSMLNIIIITHHLVIFFKPIIELYPPHRGVIKTKSHEVKGQNVREGHELQALKQQLFRQSTF